MHEHARGRCDTGAVLAIGLALGASACYGISNFLGPELSKTHALVAVLVISQLAALLACALYLAADGGAPLSAHYTTLAVVAGIGNAGGLIGFYKAAALGPLSVVAPIGAMGAIIPVVWGLARGDALSGLQVIGIVLSLGGAALVSRKTALPPQAQGLETHRVPRYEDRAKSIWWAALSAIAFGVFLTALPEASPHGRAWSLFDARLALLAALAIWAGSELREVRFRPSAVALTAPGLLLVAGTLLYTVAADHGQLSIVSVAGSLFPVFTIGLGVALLGERLSTSQAVGVLAALSGIVLVAI
jgi:drug/metabolite transporter (DMT)-like permease